MEITFSTEGRTLVVRLIGELDEHAAEYAKRILDERLKGLDFDSVVYDLSRLTFMDSTGIGVMIGRYKLLKNKCPVYVKRPSCTVDKIFKMSGLYEIMKKIG